MNRVGILIILVVSVAIASCAGDKKRKILEDLQKDWKTENLSSPIVEAYIEYGGAELEWAGQEKVIVHVYAKDSKDNNAVVSVTPTHFSFKSSERNPAQQNKPQPLTISAARDRLKVLSSKMSEKPVTLSSEVQSVRYLASVAVPVEKQGQSCNYPIRVWMARANGAVLEKHGCRYQDTWSAAVSRTATDFLKTIQ